MKRRIFAATIILTLVLAVFSGCGGGSAVSSSDINSPVLSRPITSSVPPPVDWSGVKENAAKDFNYRRSAGGIEITK